VNARLVYPEGHLDSTVENNSIGSEAVSVGSRVE